MDRLLNSYNFYKKMTEYKYRIILSKRGKEKTLEIVFDMDEYFHLVGLHKINDIEQLKRKKREFIYQKIETQKITYNDLKNSKDFHKFEKRMDAFEYLECNLDALFDIAEFKNFSPLYWKIEADYITKHTIQSQDIFIFLKKIDTNKVFCNSTFFKIDQDYFKNQSKYTLLYIDKMNISTKQIIKCSNYYNKNPNDYF